MRKLTGLISFVVLVSVVTPLLAQPVPSRDPWSTHIFPAGARRGTTLQVRVGAECIPPFTTFQLKGKGYNVSQVLTRKLRPRGEPSPRRLPTEVPVTYPKEWQGKVQIPKTAQLGPMYWHISCAQGGSASRPFVIGDLPEFIERESNSLPARAEKVTMPVTINGQISGERDMDYFTFEAKKNSVVVCDVLSQRLGSRLDPVVEMTHADGRPLKTQEIRVGSDPVVAFKVPATGRYRIRIAGLTKYGNPAFVYRINLTTKPFVHFALPAGGLAGSKINADLFVLTGSGYRLAQHVFQMPQQAGEAYVQYPANTSRTFLLNSSSRPQLKESTANNQRRQAMPVKQPAAIYGQFESSDDVDWFEVNVPAGQTWQVRCRAFPDASNALPVVQLVSAQGKRTQITRSVDTPDGQCRLQIKGKAFLRISDLREGAQGGAEFLYRLQIGPQQRDFQLETGRNYLALLQGGSASVPVTVRRSGGFTGPIKLSVKGLPAEVKAEGLTIAKGATKQTIKLTAKADAPSAGYSLQITGEAKDGKQTLVRTATATHLGRDAEGNGIASSRVDWINVTLKHKPIFRLYCSEAYMYAYRGSIYPYAMEVERLGKFAGPVIVQIGDRQNRDLDGVQMIETKIPKDQADFFLPIYLPETMFINVQSQSQLYCQAYAVFQDKHNRRQSVLVVSEKRNMIRTLPPVVKMKARKTKLLGTAGADVACPLVLERTSNFLGQMKVQLRIAPRYRALVTLNQACTIAANRNSSLAQLRISKQAKSGTRIPVTLRATGEMHEGNIAVTEVKVTLLVK